MWEDGQYSLDTIGKMLLKETPGSMYNSIFLVGNEPWQRPWQNFAHCLKTGESAFEHVMGFPFFDYFEKYPQFGQPFHDMGSAYAIVSDPAIVSAYDFTPFQTVCVIGGGQGMFLKRILESNPHLTGILYEQESVAQNHVLADQDGRVEIISGDFFKKVPEADVLILKAVLHDWPDEKCRVILDKCQEAMQRHPNNTARLVIVDRVIGEPLNPIDGFYDLHRQVQLGGRERTAEEFSILLQSSGLQLLHILPTASPVIPLKIIEAS
jgi:hypothetical protein